MGALFANAWRQPHMTSRVLLTAVAFSLTASGVYIINDLIDRDQDLNHPRKKHRPLAAQTVSVGAAVSLLIALWIVAFVIGYLVAPKVLVILLAYAVINIAYSVRLKHVVVLDVFIIAAGFMLRILAGTIGVGIAPSQWLLLCGLMMALFLGFAKRRAELYATTGDGAAHRKVLDHYQPVLLDKMIVVTATCVILVANLHRAVCNLRYISLHLFAAQADRRRRPGAGDLSRSTHPVLASWLAVGHTLADLVRP